MRLPVCVPPPLREQRDEEDAKDRTKGVAQHTKHQWDDARLRMPSDIPGGDHAHGDDRAREEHGAAVQHLHARLFGHFTMRGRMKSRAKLVDSAFNAVLSEPMAVAKMPAATSPRSPAGIT